ncbi:hypothetical protein [Pseudaestuariivita rosea]|uniref:hypothetical protein n=1 Tax=Pseudaestuariivita rosea TaxID=2763263 RepID=UPI001ABA8918|nr:hypothetical protein [Pseudaestuariivita rosea]
MNKTIVILLGIFATILASMPAVAEKDGSRDVAANSFTWDNCSVPVERLTTQETRPFMFLGNLVDRNHPRWHEFDHYIALYPDARSCLIKDEQDKMEPNLLNIDWLKLRPAAAKRVCFFRIFTSLQTHEQIKSWLSHHGFSAYGPRRVKSLNYEPRHEDDPIAYIAGTMSAEGINELTKPLLWRLTGMTIAYGFSISVSLNDKGEVVGVHTSSSTK